MCNKYADQRERAHKSGNNLAEHTDVVLDV